MDFTVKKYRELLNSMKNAGYSFQTYKDFMESPKDKVIILRHDVDLNPKNSLLFATIQHELEINGVYYFRAVKESWDEEIIKKISSLGHEIGYHYENITTTNGNLNLAIKDFENNLALLRKLAPVSTICMHGSPLSKYDSKDLWKTNDYKSHGIIAEPYFDTDFNQVFYLTDTGMKWNGEKTSIRDFVNSSFQYNFTSTSEIIKALNVHSLPDKIMFTFHPQRWNDNLLKWSKEYILQSLKNRLKIVLKLVRKNS
jgi:hypothetical protein